VNYSKPSPIVKPEPRRAKAVRMPVKLYPVVVAGTADGAETNPPSGTPAVDTPR
jgi:hypothetical protein